MLIIGKLSAVKVAREKRPGMYGDGGGLYLHVGKTGTRSWLFRFWVPARDLVPATAPPSPSALPHGSAHVRFTPEKRTLADDSRMSALSQWLTSVYQMLHQEAARLSKRRSGGLSLKSFFGCRVISTSSI